MTTGERLSLACLAQAWRTRARSQMRAAASEEGMGRRLLEHGGMCYLNAALELERLLNTALTAGVDGCQPLRYLGTQAGQAGRASRLSPSS